MLLFGVSLVSRWEFMTARGERWRTVEEAESTAPILDGVLGVCTIGDENGRLCRS
jgi:hypothetical protein